MRRVITIIVIFISTISCSAQSLCEQLHILKQKYYGFTPLTLTSKQIDAKSAELDKFWSLAKTDKPRAAECLKDMILSEKTDTYFCFDASSLLMQIDDQGKYLDAVMDGLQKCNLKELQLEEYLRMCYILGIKGKDISGLTEKLISEPNATVFLTMHVITLSAIDASLFLYNTMSTTKAEESLSHVINSGNPTGRNNAAIILSIISTPRGDSLLTSLIQNKQLADSTVEFLLKERRKFIHKIICKGEIPRNEILWRLKNYPGNPDQDIVAEEKFICSACKFLKPDDIEVVRAARQKSTPGLSDEALYDYYALTTILINIRNK